MKRLFICNRNNQCGEECYEECHMTTDFLKSKAYHSIIKPADIFFIRLTPDKGKKEGDWWEVGEHGENSPGEEFVKKPEEFLKVPYDFLLQCELKRRLKHDKTI